jgi:two-component system response regulator YesN
MRRALELLREGKLPVRDVANSVGYRQPAQFAKTFRRHHGAPPSSFRGPHGGPRSGNGLAAAT